MNKPILMPNGIVIGSDFLKRMYMDEGRVELRQEDGSIIYHVHSRIMADTFGDDADVEVWRSDTKCASSENDWRAAAEARAEARTVIAEIVKEWQSGEGGA